MVALVAFDLIFSVLGDDGSKSRTAAAMIHTSGPASEEMRDAASIMSLGVRADIPLWSCGALVEPTTRVTLWPILSMVRDHEPSPARGGVGDHPDGVDVR